LIYVLFYMDNTSLRSLVGKNIKKAREKCGFSQEKLSVRAKLSEEYISRLEGGYVNISIDSLNRICSVLGIDVYLLFVSPKREKRAKEMQKKE